MKLHTIRTRVRGVARAWHQQYGATPAPDKAEIGRRLDALEANATAKEVEDIIGNDTWTTLDCDECKRKVAAVVEIGDPSRDSYERRDVCKKCLRTALRLMSRAPSR